MSPTNLANRKTVQSGDCSNNAVKGICEQSPLGNPLFSQSPNLSLTPMHIHREKQFSGANMIHRRTTGTLLSVLFVFATAGSLLLPTAAVGQTDTMSPARNLIDRIAPGRSSDFIVEQIAAAEGRNVFELEGRGAKVIVRGDSPLSAAVGFNWYLKYYAHAHVSLNGCQVNLPPTLPAVPQKVRMTGWVVGEYAHRKDSGYNI